MSNENGQVSPAVMALAHVVRRDVIACLARGVDTPKGIADATDHDLGVVSYHARMLVGYGVIEVASTAPVRGALQHHLAFTAGAVEALEGARDFANAAIKSARRGVA